LNDYVQVNERIVAGTPDVLAKIRSVAIQPPQMLSEHMGYLRCRVTLEDGRYACGTASFDLSLEGRSAQATNPIEDAETSAVGRALAFLGYHANRSIASREEVQEAQRRAERRPTQARRNGAERAQERPSGPSLTPAQQRAAGALRAAGLDRQGMIDVLGRYGAEGLSELTDAEAERLAADLAGGAA